MDFRGSATAGDGGDGHLLLHAAQAAAAIPAQERKGERQGNGKPAADAGDVGTHTTTFAVRAKDSLPLLEDRYKKNSDLVKFIELVCKGKLKIRNRSKVDIKVDMKTYDLPFELISTPMSKCTIEERDELLKQNEEIKKELDYIKKTTIKQMYINDLDELRKKYVKIFK